MTKKKVIFGLTALLMLVTACFAFVCCNDNNGDKTLPDVGEMIVDGQTAYKVVIPSNATATQEYSAQQICSYFAQVTGVTMSYVADGGEAYDGNSTIISLGKTSAYNTAVKNYKNVDVSRETLNDDGFVMFTDGKSLFIDSYNDRGIMYGAFEFIEQNLGVKFLTYDYTYVPTVTQVVLKGYDKTYVSPFRQRVYLNTPIWYKDTDYVAHMRYNTDFCNMPENMGSSTKWSYYGSGGDATHTGFRIVVPSDYMETVDVTVTDACGNFVENYYMPQNYIDGIKTITHSSDNGWQTFADFRNGGTGAEDAKKFVLQKYKYHTGPSSWFAGGGFCIEMGGWDNIHSGLEDDDLPGGGMANLFMWCKLKLGGNATKLRTYFQYRETDATFKYKLRHTFVDIETKQVLHLSDWKTGEFKNDPNLVAGETFIESDIPAEYRGKTVIVMLEYDDIDYTTDGILNGVESVNIKYFSVLNFDGQPIENALWVLGDSIMTEDFTGTMVAEIAKESGYTLFRDTISGSTVAPASSIGIVDHIDSGMYANNFGVFGSPKVIVIQRGTNDVYWSGQEGNPLKLGNVTDTDKTTTYGAIRYTLDYFTQLYPQARIIWSTAFYRTDVDDVRMRQYNENLKTICAEYDNVEVFDLYEKTGFNETNAVQYLIDGIHPSNSGKAVLKKLWIELLTK